MFKKIIVIKPSSKYIYVDYFGDQKRPCKIISNLNYYTSNSYC